MIDNNKHIVYFIGIGGIGMSALAQYFINRGWEIFGYDRTISDITRNLEKQGAIIHYEDSIESLPQLIKTAPKDELLVIYTPAIPSDSPLLQLFKEKNIPVYKRSQVLGYISLPFHTIAVAGTHGKTTISSIIAHIFNSTEKNTMAFLGGISKNYQSNFIDASNPKYVVVEADEYDRSFLNLSPHTAVVTAVDPDHLDIYKNHDAMIDAYYLFASKIKGGRLLVKKGLATKFKNLEKLDIKEYSTTDKADCTISNLRIDKGFYLFDIITPWGNITNIKPGITGDYNVENVLAAASIALWYGLDKVKIRNAIETFTGVKRRLDMQYYSDHCIYIDDYAHHPAEITALIQSVRHVFPGKPITGIFQPHLYSRTRDLADDFAKALSLLDELWLLDIYPAREKPIEGVTSKIIFDKVTITNKRMLQKEEIFDLIKKTNLSVLLTIGAGDIDQMVEPIKKCLNEK